MDIGSMKTSKDIHGLIRLLNHSDYEIQWRAADALGTMGEAACDLLHSILEYPEMQVRLGAIEALGDIKSPRSVEPLIQKLRTDKDNEVRWVAALALGEIGDVRAIPPLVEALSDPDRYVRYGAVMSLEKLSWTPDTKETLASMLIAQQEWDTLSSMKSAAIGPLIKVLKDPNPKTRVKIIDCLGLIGGPIAKKACEDALMDPDPTVRWKAVSSCRQCGVARHEIPLILANRPKTGPSAIGAAALNLFFFGHGYNYIGKWWGAMIFMIYMTCMVFVQLITGIQFPYIFIYPITALFAIQTYYSVKRM